jgi:hypothetical protein
MVRFLDSSVFLHAYLKPKRELRDAEKEIKKKAIKYLKILKEEKEL